MCFHSNGEIWGFMKKLFIKLFSMSGYMCALLGMNVDSCFVHRITVKRKWGTQAHLGNGHGVEWLEHLPATQVWGHWAQGGDVIFLGGQDVPGFSLSFTSVAGKTWLRIRQGACKSCRLLNPARAFCIRPWGKLGIPILTESLGGPGYCREHCFLGGEGGLCEAGCLNCCWCLSLITTFFKDAHLVTHWLLLKPRPWA